MAGFSLLRKLREGTNVTQVAWSPDGSKLATASHYSDTSIWNAKTWQAKILRGSHWTHSIAWSPDSKRLVTAEFPETTAFWNADTGEKLSSMVHIAPVRDMVFCSASHLLTTADNQILAWNVTDNGILGPLPARTIIGHRELVRCLALHPGGKIMASGADDGDVRIWDCTSWKCSSILGGHARRVLALTWSNDGSLLASGSIDSTIRIWDSSFRPIRILEGHTGPVRALSFSHDRRLLASKSDDETVRIWRCDDWENLESISERSMIGNLAFHPQLPLLATQDDAIEHEIVRVWEVQINDLLGRAPLISVASYTNAKIVLVGDTGVGKSGLALVLTGQPFKPTESTHGRRVWTMDRSTILGGKETREVLLWDLAGQTGYRLVHQLHLTEVAVAIVIFDSRSETDPFAGVRYWDRALHQAHRIQGGTFPPPKKFLVAARTDRWGVAASRNRIESTTADLGFDGYFETSAKEGWQIKELSAAVLSAIPWDMLPRVASSKLFQDIKDFLVGEKGAGRILSTADDLYRAFPKPHDVPENNRDLRMQFETCIGRVESRGLIKRLSFGDLVLLQPELLDSYASALVNAARTEPDGLGTLKEDYAREGRFPMAQDERIKDVKQEKLLLIATIEDLLRHEIGLREGEDLVFPAQFTREYPELPDPEGKTVIFQFDGSAQTIYTTLAVRLAHSGMFQTQEMWRNAAVYSFAGERCGMFLREPEEGKGKLTLFFNPGATQVTKHQFEEFVFTHLQRRALPESVNRRRVIGCPKCGDVITDRQAQARRELGKTTIYCPVCETEFSILEKEEPTERFPVGLRKLDLMADSRRDYAAAKSVLDGKMSTNDFDVFLCHKTEDKPAIRRIGETLKSVGLLPWLDEWELPPGKPWQPALEKAIKEIRSAAVFVGPSGLGPWQDLEQQAFLREFIRRDCPVIPVILPGCAQKPGLPVFLSGMQWVDFREEDPNPLERLVWGITGKRPGGEADITYTLVSNLAISELLQQIQEDQIRESAKTLHQQANTEYSKGDYPEAERLYNESLTIERKLGDESGIATTLHQLANIEYSKGKYPKAKKLYEESLTIKIRLGDQSGIATTLEQMGRIAEEEGEFRLAKKHYQQAFEIFEKLGEKPYVELVKKDLERVQQRKHRTQKPEI